MPWHREAMKDAVVVPSEYLEVREIFLHPEVTDDYSVKWSRVDPEGVRRVMCDRHGFSVDRIDAVLGKLAQKVLKLVSELPRLRLSSIDSVEADPALMAAIAEEERLMPHLHLSLQAGHDLTLKRMKFRPPRYMRSTMSFSSCMVSK